MTRKQVVSFISCLSNANLFICVSILYSIHHMCEFCCIFIIIFFYAVSLSLSHYVRFVAACNRRSSFQYSFEIKVKNQFSMVLLISNEQKKKKKPTDCSFGLDLMYSFGVCIASLCPLQVSLINFLASLAGAGGIQAFKTMRTLRALRPLRAMSRMQGMRVGTGFAISPKLPASALISITLSVILLIYLIIKKNECFCLS